MRTYVRARTGDQGGGAPARRRRRERLRDRRRLGIPRSTVRDWRRPSLLRATGSTCPRCWRSAPPLAFSDPDYAELLGLYLGDGNISQLARTQSLRISLDARYPAIVDDTEALLRRCFPNNRVGRVVFRDGGGGRGQRLLRSPRLPVPAARTGQEARAPDPARGLATKHRRGGAVAVPPRVASAPTDASSSIAPAATSTSATASRTIRPTSWISSSPRAARKASVRAATHARSGSTGAAMSHACSSTSA